MISTYTGRYLEETMDCMITLVNFIERNMFTEVQELVCDFVKDESNIWWVVACKAFKVKNRPFLVEFMGEADDHSVRSKAKLHTEYEKLNRCRLCQRPLSQDKLTHHLTIQMITFTDQHLRERGVMIKWLDRAEYRHSNHATLYQSCLLYTSPSPRDS